jgi:hypothetical protein
MRLWCWSFVLAFAVLSNACGRTGFYSEQTVPDEQRSNLDQCNGADCGGHGTCTANSTQEVHCECDYGFYSPGFLTCVARPPCETEVECQDDNPCTADICRDGMCFWENQAASCDDGLFCTAVDTCVDGACVGSGSTCPNTECNHCDEANDSCFDPQGTACSDDGMFCNGVETCDGAGSCVSAGDPCPDTGCNRCNEGNDSCFDPQGTTCTDDGLLC